MASPLILVVGEPSPVLRSELARGQYRTEVVASAAQATDWLSKNPLPDLLLLRCSGPNDIVDSLDALQDFRELNPTVKVVINAVEADTRTAVKAGRLGATDYITEEIPPAKLRDAIQDWLSSPAEALSPSEQPLPKLTRVAKDIFFVCASQEMRRVYSAAASFANFDIPVLLLGESGTGKEVISLLIHSLSSRAREPFLKVNCAALPANLLESELFGFEAGSFSGATKAKPGKFELCNNGTILLDEIGEMPRELQAKLLHVLQDGQFCRLGGQQIQKVDVRILSATNVDVEKAIAAKQLREDLYYRLSGFTIHIPPLRERKTEIPPLMKHFMRRMADQHGRRPLDFTQRLIHACLSYSWPGNIRELENFVKRYFVLGDENLALSALQLSKEFAEPTTNASDSSGLKGLARSAKKEAEAGAILNALSQTRWHRGKAATLLNISYKALLYKIQEYGLSPPEEL